MKGNCLKGVVKQMEYIRALLKIVMWFLIIEFGCNFIMQTISYSFYKNAKKMSDISCLPQFIQFTDTLTGYGYNMDQESDKVIIFFGGSNYTAYNTVGKYADKFDCPFISVDYYGTQDSKGKMNLSSMKHSAEDVYDWAVEKYKEKNIVIMGHSYGTGMATYLASIRECKNLILAAGYRDISDLYNKMIPIFWGPLKVFISNNIEEAEYAKNVKCPVYIIGSNADKTLSVDLQSKLSKYFDECELQVVEDIKHEDYFTSDCVLKYLYQVMN